MTEKMHTQAGSYVTGPRESLFQSEQFRRCTMATGCVSGLATLGYTLVRLCHAGMAGPSQPDVEIVIGYILIILGYLLLPGVGVLLVRRKRCLAYNRALLMTDSDAADAHFKDAFGSGMLSSGWFGTRQVLRDVEAATRCSIWGSHDRDDVLCAVCLNDVDEGCEVRTLPCQHVFHRKCSDLWLVNGRKNSCPMCLGSVCPQRDGDMRPLR